jgi:regulator of cell morphogenesis and NO signaling
MPGILLIVNQQRLRLVLRDKSHRQRSGDLIVLTWKAIDECVSKEKKMIASAEKTVRELALEIPNATRIFERLGIDYCCGGNQSLENACRRANLSVAQVLENLEKSTEPTVNQNRDWKGGMLADLVQHIQSTHHKYTREEIVRLQPLLEKVCRVHGQNHPELLSLRETFRALATELTVHLMKEEMVLFPYLIRMEEAARQQEPKVAAPFGPVQNPVQAMMLEHDSAGEALRNMREASRDYAVPEDGCFSYRTLYQALQAFESDLHQHIHLENNILFPRAIEMEAAS